MEKRKSSFPKFLLLWAGELISAVGSGLTSFGLGVYVFRQTGSAGSMALVTLLAFLPTLLLSVPAGVLADRYDRRLLMMAGDGCSALGILILVVVSSVMTCFMGCFQILAQPLILDFADSTTLGIGEMVCACGMLASSLFLGVKGIRQDYVKILSISLLLAGLMMVGFGLWESIVPICLFGFLFFATLPFANNCLDYLVRTNIPDELQGRSWGVIGFLSQIGYVVAYAGAGAAADGIAAGFDLSVGRAAAVVVVIAGILLAVTALCLYPVKSVRALEGVSC